MYCKVTGPVDFRWSSDENKEPCEANGTRVTRVANYYCLKRSDRNECRIQFRDAQPHNAGLWKLTITRRIPYGEYSLKIRYVHDWFHPIVKVACFMFVLLRLNVLEAPKKDEDFPEDTAVIRAAVNDSCLCHSRDILGGDLQGLFIDHPVQTPRQCQGPLSHGVRKQMELMTRNRLLLLLLLLLWAMLVGHNKSSPSPVDGSQPFAENNPPFLSFRLEFTHYYPKFMQPSAFRLLVLKKLLT